MANAPVAVPDNETELGDTIIMSQFEVPMGGSIRLVNDDGTSERLKAREDERRDITRRITAEVFAEFQWREDEGAEHIKMPVALREKQIAVQREIDKRCLGTFKAAGLA
jgi:hypothetical protein